MDENVLRGMINDQTRRIRELEEQVRVLQEENRLREDIIIELQGLEEGWWIKPIPNQHFYDLYIHHGSTVVYHLTLPKSILNGRA